MLHFKINEQGLSVRKDQYGRLAAVIRCSECGGEGSVPIKSAAHASVSEFIDKKFREKKWEIGKDHRNDVCPQCIAVRRKPSAKLTVVEPTGKAMDDYLETMLAATETPTPKQEPVVNTEIPRAGSPPPPPFTPPPAAEPEKTRAVLTRKEEFAVGDELRKVLVLPADEEGFIKYLEGNNDSTVYEALKVTIPHLRQRHVERIRSDIFGTLRAPRNKREPNDDRIDALEKRIEQLEQMVLELTTK